MVKKIEFFLTNINMSFPEAIAKLIGEYSEEKMLRDDIDVKNLDLDMLSANPEAMDLLMANPDKINWKYLNFSQPSSNRLFCLP